MPTFDARSVRKRHTRLGASNWGPSARSVSLALDLTHCLSSLRRTAQSDTILYIVRCCPARTAAQNTAGRCYARVLAVCLGASVRPIPVETRLHWPPLSDESDR